MQAIIVLIQAQNDDNFLYSHGTWSFSDELNSTKTIIHHLSVGDRVVGIYRNSFAWNLMRRADGSEY